MSRHEGPRTRSPDGRVGRQVEGHALQWQCAGVFHADGQFDSPADGYDAGLDAGRETYLLEQGEFGVPRQTEDAVVDRFKAPAERLRDIADGEDSGAGTRQRANLRVGFEERGVTFTHAGAPRLERGETICARRNFEDFDQRFREPRKTAEPDKVRVIAPNIQPISAALEEAM